ncbi:MAG: DUF1573 domain-containing protein [Muribaculaceae bacterium]|nr:DUF1573 domain-containing protein [Muribaculaceae bacterium]
MRRAAIIAACALIVLATARAAAQTASWPSTTGDLGLIDEADGAVTTRFALVNSGDAPLVVTRAKSTCGCTATRCPQGEIAPGDTAWVEVTFSPRGVIGHFEKSIFVYTTGTERSTQLTLTGTVRPTDATIDQRFPLAVGPLRVNTLTLPMGEHSRGVMRNKVIAAYNPTRDTLYVEPLPGDNVHIVAHAVPDTVAPGTSATLTFIYNTRLAPMLGFNSDTVALRCATAAGAVHEAPVTVTAVVREDFSQWTEEELAVAPVATLETMTIDFDRITGHKTMKRTLRLTNKGKSNLQMRRIYSTEAALAPRCDAKIVRPGERTDIVVELTPDELDGDLLNATIDIITNDPAHPVQTVRAVGQRGANN